MFWASDSAHLAEHAPATINGNTASPQQERFTHIIHFRQPYLGRFSTQQRNALDTSVASFRRRWDRNVTTPGRVTNCVTLQGPASHVIQQKRPAKFLELPGDGCGYHTKLRTPRATQCVTRRWVSTNSLLRGPHTDQNCDIPEPLRTTCHALRHASGKPKLATQPVDHVLRHTRLAKTRYYAARAPIKASGDST